ncbi:unnamed protein product [Closterium sp. Naga37s-1]|nr:unnamed protein product [Closterium sp. Naga37s-1]
MRLSLSDSVDEHPASANHSSTSRGACSRRASTWSAAEKKKNRLRVVAAAASAAAPVLLVEGGRTREARAAGCLDALICLKSAQIDSVRRERAGLSAQLAEGLRRVLSMETGMAERRLTIESLVSRISEKRDMKRRGGTTDGGKGVMGEAIEREGAEDGMEILDNDEDEDMLDDVGCDGVRSSVKELRAVLQFEIRAMMADMRRLELAVLHTHLPASFRLKRLIFLAHFHPSDSIAGELRRKSAELDSMREVRGQLVRRKDMLGQQQLLLPAG